MLVSSTVDPAYVAALAPRLSVFGIALLDAPVSGGPAKAAAGTMTMMVSGDTEAFARVRTILDRIAGRVFMLGPRPGDASTFKIVNNMLAAANLAAGAEALAIAQAAGLDLQRVCDVVNASSGASWIFADRVARALDRRLCPARRDAPARQGCGDRGGARGPARRRRAVHPDRDEGVCRGDGRRVRRGRRCGVGAPRARRREATQRPVADCRRRASAGQRPISDAPSRRRRRIAKPALGASSLGYAPAIFGSRRAQYSLRRWTKQGA